MGRGEPGGGGHGGWVGYIIGLRVWGGDREVEGGWGVGEGSGLGVGC